jgi:hypothetical protein
MDEDERYELINELHCLELDLDGFQEREGRDQTDDDDLDEIDSLIDRIEKLQELLRNDE